MKKFNSLFVAGKTSVQLPGEYGYRKVAEVHETRNWIKIDGVVGSFQRNDIKHFTNKSNVKMWPQLEDKYTSDQYGSVYEMNGNQWDFIGKLNGSTLQQFISEYENQLITGP